MYRIGIDLGGTNIAVGVVDDNFKILGEGKVKTNAPRPADEITPTPPSLATAEASPDNEIPTPIPPCTIGR